MIETQSVFRNATGKSGNSNIKKFVAFFTDKVNISDIFCLKITAIASV